MGDPGRIETTVVDGLALANELRDAMSREIASLVAAGHRPPHLTVVLVGVTPWAVGLLGRNTSKTKPATVSTPSLPVPRSVNQSAGAVPARSARTAQGRAPGVGTPSAAYAFVEGVSRPTRPSASAK